MTHYQLNLNIADRVIIPKSIMNIIQHHAIYAGYDAYGGHWFLENHYASGVRYVNSYQFFAGISLSTIRIQRFCGTELQRIHAINRAKQMVGHPYDLLSYNCEHYSNDVQLGSSESNQVKAGLFLAGILACVVGIFANSK